MVIDHLSRASVYHGLGRGIRDALQFLAQADLAAISPGRHELSSGSHAIIREYQTKPVEGALFEAHRRFIDVQFVVSGSERIGYAPLEVLCEAQPYDDERDVVKLEGQGDLVLLPEGTFAVLWPGDGHMPGIHAGDRAARVRKVVVKVPVSG